MSKCIPLLPMFFLLATLLIAVGCGDDDDNDDDSTVDDDASPNDDDGTDDDDNDTSPVTDDDDNNNDDTADDDDDNDTDPGDPLEPTDGYLARQAEYLEACRTNNAPPDGGFYSQACRIYMGETTFDEDEIQEKLAQINAREDCSDFDMNGLLRMLFLDNDRQVLPAALREQMEAAVLDFKYWLDEPGADEMCWWSENHQILFHTAELLAGQLFLDEEFSNSGMTGQEHIDHALPKIQRWLSFRGRFGFSEFHSNVYFNEDMPPLVNLVDFAEDETIARQAAMVLDILAYDMACNYYQGLFATAHGRTYQSKLLEGLSDSTQDAAWIMLGLGGRGGDDGFTGTHLATSDLYWPPAILEDIAGDALTSLEHKQSDSIDVQDGPDYGIGYETWDDIMFWWGATGYVAPEVISGTFLMVEEFNMWEGFLWSDIAFLRFLVGSPLLPLVANLYEEVFRGVTLEHVGTYTYRTPYYQLSGAQAFKPGNWAAQVHVWQATIDRDAYVFTTYPGGLEDDYMGGPWTGGFLPRATFYQNVGIIQYQRPKLPLFDQLLFVDYSHAYFPKNAFDEVRESGNWTIGRKGEAYVALFSENEPVWSEENDYELIADAKENVWIIELGDAENNGSFDEFVADIETATVEIDAEVTYGSVSQGVMTVAWEGPLTVDGAPADLGPYARFDNPYGNQEFGDNRTILEFDGQRLDLNFENATRRYWAD